MGPKRNQNPKKQVEDSDSGEATPPRRLGSQSSSSRPTHSTASRNVPSRRCDMYRSAAEACRTARMAREEMNRPTCSGEGSAPRRSLRLSQQVYASSLRDAVMPSPDMSRVARRHRHRQTTQEGVEALPPRRMAARTKKPRGSSLRRVVHEQCARTRRLEKPTTSNERSASKESEALPPMQMPMRVARHFSASTPSASTDSYGGHTSTSSAPFSSSGRLTKTSSTGSNKSQTKTDEPRPSTSRSLESTSRTTIEPTRVRPASQPSPSEQQPNIFSSILRRVRNFFSGGGARSKGPQKGEEKEKQNM